MLQLTILLGPEMWDEKKEMFVEPKKQVLQLEHSLVSISKWESKWCKPFLSKDVMTVEETIDYIRCMTLTQNVNPDVYNYITDENIRQVNKYIEAPMTATWFAEEKNGKRNNKQVTNELIYYWMARLDIPFECQKWHFNRLLTFIRVCNVEDQPAKKMSKKDTQSYYAALNAARKKQLHTKG